MRGTRALLHQGALPQTSRTSTSHFQSFFTSHPAPRRFFTPQPALRSFFTSSGPRARPQLSSNSIIRNAFSRRLRFLRRSKSDKAPNNGPTASETQEASLSFSQRMKKLSKEYGWTALSVYMALSVLDFPFCFLAVRALGTDRIGHYEHVVVQWFKNTFGIEKKQVGVPGSGGVAEAVEREELGISDDIEEAQAANQGATASIWTELALAYAIHKSFIFIRVPAAAAITPKVVKALRKRGWDIGKKKPKKPSSNDIPKP
ncbi:hypothetical protein M011DRAFT_469415 [Sporormia fimetaria CBS 119925]|uniref:DUF1279 domain-containing protein n=1 Tax=Sporormia fimetaria CBS 119925 TaxID=1340428 RepID=A0A6A6V5H9_9PLEO|nr:hypothetical protein M011DRAFT_469415 [Sporormia fimetaria CBS 119925]